MSIHERSSIYTMATKKLIYENSVLIAWSSNESSDKPSHMHTITRAFAARIHKVCE